MLRILPFERFYRSGTIGARIAHPSPDPRGSGSFGIVPGPARLSRYPFTPSVPINPVDSRDALLRVYREDSHREGIFGRFGNTQAQCCEQLHLEPLGSSPLRRRMKNELNFPPNFERLVLGCIDADFCK